MRLMAETWERERDGRDGSRNKAIRCIKIMFPF
jgi:hypothetical protein